MTCEQVAREEMLEKYLCDSMSEAERDAFEQHCLECAHCFEQLEALGAVRAALLRSESAIRLEPVVAPSPWRKKWAWAAAAAVVLLAATVGVGIWRARISEITPPAVATTPAPAAPLPSLSELAVFQPPPYAPATLRGSADEATKRFQAAMQHYAKGDNRAAIPGLLSAAALDPKAPNVQFFLGICYLATEQDDAGVERLRKTISLGETLYLEGARFYLAKAYLRQGKLNAAEEELKETVKLKGDFAPAAQELLRKVQVVQDRRR